MLKQLEIHFCTKDRFQNYKWFHNIPEETQIEISMGGCNIVVENTSPRRLVCVLPESESYSYETDIEPLVLLAVDAMREFPHDEQLDHRVLIRMVGCSSDQIKGLPMALADLFWKYDGDYTYKEV